MKDFQYLITRTIFITVLYGNLELVKIFVTMTVYIDITNENVNGSLFFN